MGYFSKAERNFTKDEILTMYLNKFDFLYLAVGIKSAAKIYFNTTPEELTIEQAAVLVGMAKNPHFIILSVSQKMLLKEEI